MPGPLAAVLSAVVTAALCALGPRLIRSLPEPPPVEPGDDAPSEVERERDGELFVDRDDAVGADAGEGADAGASSASSAEPVEAPAAQATKIPYAELASRPRLGLKLAAVGAVVGAVVGWVLADEPILAAWVFLAAVGTVLGYVDAQTRLLPTRIIAPSYAVLVALILVAAWLDGEKGGLLHSAYGWAAFGGFYFFMWFIYPKGLGYGDVRLSGLLGLSLGYLGWGPVLVGMYAGFLLGGIGGGLLALARIVDRKRYPFGPFMLVGALVGLVWGASFADWYTGI